MSRKKKSLEPELQAQPQQDRPQFVSFFGARFPYINGIQPAEIACALLGFLDPPVLKQLGSKWTKADFFWHIVEMLWGPQSVRHFVRHPWAERMVDAACQSNYLGISGCASSGKTDFGAVWGLVNWLAAPMLTKVLVTSTGLKEARNRIWGACENYFMASIQKLPGKLVSSIGQIRMEEGLERNARAGIELIAGDASREKEAIGKLIGLKSPRVIMIADELPELSENILSAAFSNLSSNPVFQLIALGNFKSTLDAFGTFTEPAAGWQSVSVESEGWQTTRGKCIRLDGLKSPNVVLGFDKWPIYGTKQLDEHRKMGENTALFWRMCRSYMAPIGIAEFIYTEAELLKSGAFSKVEWAGPVTRLAALDPGFTNDGDRCMLAIGSLGTATNGKRVLCLDRMVQLKEDVTVDQPMDFQIANLFRVECESENVKPEDAAFDATGAGISFGSIVEHEWDRRVMPIRFGGAASEWPMDSTGRRLAKDVYANRVSELWYQGREYLRASQLAGITKDLAKEMIARKYTTRKSTEALIVVEPKREMKARIGISPDMADAFMMMVELARARHGWVPAGFGRMPQATVDQETNQWVQKLDNVYADEAVLAG